MPSAPYTDAMRRLPPAEGVLHVEGLDALHHIVIEVGPALGSSDFFPDQLVIPFALLDLSYGVLSVSFHDLNRRGRVHNPTLGGEFRIALEGRNRRLGRRSVSENEEQKARA